MADSSPESAIVHFVFDYPTTSDVVAGTALSANAGLRWLDLFGLKPEQVSTSHLIRCNGGLPILRGTVDHCRVHDARGVVYGPAIFTHSLRQGIMVPAFRRLISLDVAKALRLAPQGLKPVVYFGKECLARVLPHAFAVEDDLRKWRGHIHDRNAAFLSWFPPIVRTHGELEALLRSTSGPIGLDLEYDVNETPTMIGLSFRRHDESYVCGAVPWNASLAANVVDSGRQIVAYSAFEADKPVLDRAVRVVTDPNRWEDPMQLHWIHNRDLFDVPSSEDDGTSMMLMSIWTAASIVMDVPNWKQCRGAACEGRICRIHDKIGYCAVDAHAGLHLFHVYEERCNA